MAGIDKITNQIIEEANHSANEILDKAKAKAEDIKAAAIKEAEAECASIAQKTEQDVKAYKERMGSSADLKRRTAILAAKQEIISETIEKAYQSFCAKNDSDYFETIRRMLKKFALPQSGEVLFSEADHKRMPDGFEKEVEKIAAENKGFLAISKETRNIKGGFILVYGGIEENCSFEALFNSKRDELQDKVQKVLFS